MADLFPCCLPCSARTELFAQTSETDRENASPPVWVACSNRETIKRAARLGIGALTFAFVDPAEAKQWVDDYYRIIKTEWVPIGHAVNANIAMVTGFSVHPDAEEAKRRGEDGFKFFGYALAHHYIFGVWAFILAYIWTNHINPRPGAQKARPVEIWRRFPKFILGFVATFAIALTLALGTQASASGKLAAAIGEANVLRVIFFTLTFFSIGVLSNFRKLWEEGLGKLAAVYVVSLFGFVVWVGFVISWLFFAGVIPPLAF